MRVAIPCDGASLESSVSMHFGRAPYYLIADISNEKIVRIEFIRNPFEDHMPGQIPRFLHSLGVNTVIAYGVGMKARFFFESLGIRVITGAFGKVKDVLEGFLKNTLVLDLDWEKREEFRRHGRFYP